ncbi:MAG TPA: PepSY domain-containing protein [Pseudomonadales bacterium]|nr:PepSY domain-containing protein [Pseudomonadales bacterium]HNC69983.1 PepSY domain-containing protein [Pseudomonadales bacterium]HND15084.1 PepSY domain-containing protein [Pseudomonadales bacterium]
MNSVASRIAAVLLLASGAAFAGQDIGPDQAVKLLQEGRIKSFEELNASAQAAHPRATIDETELEQKDGRHIYKVDLRDPQGQKWDVDLDAATGEVLRDRKDD